MTAPYSPAAEGVARRVAGVGYLILGLATALPIIDYFLSIAPFHPGMTSWRFGAIGLLATYSMGTVVELFLVMVLAVAANHRRMVTFVGVIAGILAVFILGAGLLFILDTLQTRSLVNPVSMRRFDVAAIEAMLKLFSFGIAAAWLCRVGLRRYARDDIGRGRVTSQNIPIIGRQPIPERTVESPLPAD
jgi:hypothetical protein